METKPKDIKVVVNKSMGIQVSLSYEEDTEPIDSSYCVKRQSFDDTGQWLDEADSHYFTANRVEAEKAFTCLLAGMCRKIVDRFISGNSENLNPENEQSVIIPFLLKQIGEGDWKSEYL